MSPPYLPAFPNARLPPGSWRDKLKVLAPQLDCRLASMSAAVFLSAHGAHAHAETVYREIISRKPYDVAALKGLAYTLLLTGSNDDAALMRQRALAAEAMFVGLTGSDLEETAAFLFAAEGGGPCPAMVPPAYVEKTFDSFDSFDHILVDKLKYRAPQDLRQFVDTLRQPKPKSLRVLDLGCGTGLSGAAFRDLAHTLDGVDLSAGMLERSRQKQLYDSLCKSDVVAAMQTTPEVYDLIIAIDLFIYIGDLLPSFRAAEHALAPDGALCFSVEKHDGHGFCLSGTRRFAHSVSYLMEMAQSSGMTLTIRDSSLRLENSEEVAGLLVVATRSTP